MKNVRNIRSFGDDALYKSTYYITLHYIVVISSCDKDVVLVWLGL